MTISLNGALPAERMSDPRDLPIMCELGEPFSVPPPAVRRAHVRQLVAQRGLTREIEARARLLVALAVTAEGYDVRGRASWGKPLSSAVLSCALI